MELNGVAEKLAEKQRRGEEQRLVRLAYLRASRDTGCRSSTECQQRQQPRGDGQSNEALEESP